MSGFYLPNENEFDPSIDDFVLPSVSKERRYKHFDLPLSTEKRELSIDFTREGKVHRFLPFLGFADLTRRLVREKDANGEWLQNEDGKFIKKVKEKSRSIRFAGHTDSAYLQAYAAYLNQFYERALLRDGISSSVLAYRKGGGTNIHHAKSLFDEVRRRKNCTVIAMDISGFFDCLDHMLLRDEIADVIGGTRLQQHHGTVWKNITRYSWVETRDLDIVLGKKRNGHGRVCSPSDFNEHVRGRKDGLVRKHDLSFGIPQGTPVSGLYANIYMRTFDREMYEQVCNFGGSYRRYSDDIAIVLPSAAKVEHVVAVVEKILSDFELSISAEKTEFAQFEGGKLISPKPIQYLGFTFDGEMTLIRPSSLDMYRNKMRKGIHAKLVAAKGKGIPSFNVFKREALSRYTHLGQRRNFLTYADKAADLMESPEIRQQVKPHMKWFKKAWNTEVEKVYGGLVFAE